MEQLKELKELNASLTVLTEMSWQKTITLKKLNFHK